MPTPPNDMPTNNPSQNNLSESTEFPTDIMNTSSHSKGSSFLTIIALIIVMIIVAIVLTGDLLKDAHENSLTFEEINPEMISPELKLQSTPTKSQKKEETLSLATLLQNDDESITTEEEDTEETPTTKNVEKVVQEKAIPVVEKTKTIPQIPKPHTKFIKDSYYIQIGSYSKIPSKRFLSVIETRGFHYILTSASKKGIRKLLIGPYSSRNLAVTKLHTVKDNFNKHAFIVKR